MITENLSTLKLNKLTQEQYDRELAAGNIDETALYLTPEEEIDLSGYATVEEMNKKADKEHTHEITDVDELQVALDTKANATDVAYIDIEDNENIEYTETNTGITIELVDNLESTSTTSALTANQGKVLKAQIDELNEDVESLNKNVNELNIKMPFKLGIDENGNYGYIKDGADSVIPFKKGSTYEYHGIDGKAGLNYDTTNECILILAVYSARKLNTSNYNYEYYELLGNPEEVVQNYFTVTGGQVEELSYRDFSLPGCVKCDDLGEPTLYVACVGIKFFKCTPTEDTMNITVQRVIGEAGMGCFFEKISM